MWPFAPAAPAEAPKPRHSKRLDDIELEQLELRDTQEKILVAIRKIQGRLLKRVQEAEAGENGAPGSPEPNAPAAPVALHPRNSKAELRTRAARMRGLIL